MRALLAFALVLALGACGSSAPQPDGGPATGGAEGGGGEGTTAGGSEGTDAGPTFADIVTSGKLATYKVSYRMTATGSGGDGMEQTWYFRPPDTRLDFAAVEAGTTRGRISIFYIESGTFMCTGDGRESSCFQVARGAADGLNVGFEIQDGFRRDPAGVEATPLETRMIAGQQAFCYRVRDATGAMAFLEGAFCYTRTGVPLLLQWVSGEGPVTMEATAFSTSVPDSDFSLPATPMRQP